jgi:hypothetical protein
MSGVRTLGFLDMLKGKKPAKKKRPELEYEQRIVFKIRDEAIPRIRSFLEEDTQAIDIIIKKDQDRWVIKCKLHSRKEGQALMDLIVKSGGDFYEFNYRPI